MTPPGSPDLPSGPYKLMPLIDKIDVSAPNTITAIEAWDLNVYIGTSVGEIIHMYSPQDDNEGYVQLSRQRSSSKIRPVAKIVLLPEIAKLLLLAGKTLSGYVLPELSPGNIGKLKDVSDLAVDSDKFELDSKKRNYNVGIDQINGDVYSEVTVFTSKSIRLVRVFDDSMKLSKEVQFAHSLTGAQRSSYAAVATAEGYELIDLDKSQRIPLFPVSPSSLPDGLKPHILPVGKKEFLMVCSGPSKQDPAVGMVVTVNGDVSRGTIAWNSYPTSLAVDFPYVIASFGKTATIHSLHSQRLVQSLQFDTVVKVQSVSRVFEMKDKELGQALTKVPIVSETSPEELEKIAIESDLAADKTSKSSCLVYDIHGSFVKALQPYPRPLHWLDLYSANSPTLYDELMDEIDQDPVETQLIVHILALHSLKTCNYNQAFEVFTSNLKLLDPRLVIYIVDGRHIFGSVWEFESLVGAANDVKQQYANDDTKPHAVEFMRLYLNVCKTSPEFADQTQPIMKTIEIYLLNMALDSNEQIEPVLATIKYSVPETIEILLLHKRYYYLSKFYNCQQNYKQCLYYWRQLIAGDLTDPDYDTSGYNLGGFVDYLLDHCPDDVQDIIWLVKEHPEHGFKAVTDPRTINTEFNDVQIVNFFQGDLKSSYLEYIVDKKKKKQFTGDLVLQLLQQLDPPDLIHESVEKYANLRIPKTTVYNFWKTEKHRYAPKFVSVHDKLYTYLCEINSSTKSIVGQRPVIEECSKVSLPLITLVISAKQRGLQEVVSKLCDMKDFTTAEQVATDLQLPDLNGKTVPLVDEEASDKLLMQVFDVYLGLDNAQLIDAFLTNHDLIRDMSGTVMDKMDKFSKIINRIPDSFPLSQLHRFLLQSLSEFQDHSDTVILTKNLARANLGRERQFRTALDDQ